MPGMPELNEHAKEVIEDVKKEGVECDVGEWWESFQMFDADSNGHVESNELATVLRNLGLNPTKKEVEEMIAEVDMDKKEDTENYGKIEFHEFVCMMAKQKCGHKDPEEELIQAFKVFDKNGDGFICKDELKATMKQLSKDTDDDDISDMLDMADIDDDGRISYKEFVTVICKKQLGQESDQ